MTAINRWLICGTLTANSPLQIRTGEPEEGSGTAGEAKIWAIETDFGGRPYIPGSSLKGAVRSNLEIALGAAAQSCLSRLLGDGSAGRSSGMPLGGRAEFWDCHLSPRSPAQDLCTTFTQTRVDRPTCTADDASLRTSRATMPGTVFEVGVMVERASLDDVALLVAGLKVFDGNGTALGGGTGVGRGICEFAGLRVCRMDAADIVKWMNAETIVGWKTAIENHPLSSGEHATLDQKVQELLKQISRPAEIVARLRITFDSPFLVADATKQRNGRSREGEEVDLEPLRKPGTEEVILPGSSLHGVISAQAGRIFRTVFCGAAPTTKASAIETVFEEVFGKTGWKGALTVGDFEPIGHANIPRQDLVAIDRPTGGSADKAKFAIAAAQGPAFEGVVRLRIDFPGTRPFSAAALGLLCLVWRDAVEGDSTGGYGSRKGFGRCCFSVVSIGRAPLEYLRKMLGKSVPSPDQWLASNEEFRVVVKAAVEAFRTAARTGAARDRKAS